VAWPEPAALLFLDEAGARAASEAGAIEVGGHPAPPGALSAPTEVHLQLTSRCPVRCDGCYLDAGPDAPASEPVDDDTLDALAGMGVLQIALGGGEALLRDDVIGLARRIRARGMVPNLTTSGFGLTAPLARQLAGLVGQVNVSLDGLDADYRAVRGWDGTRLALRALRLLREAGVRTGVNTVLTRANVHRLDPLADALVDHGVREWQWVRLKPAGRGADAYDRLALTRAQARDLWPRALALEERTGLVLRWDCALVPFLIEHAPSVPRLRQLGVAGCPGGHSLWSRSPDGAFSPCSFAHRPSAGATDPVAAWRDDPTLVTWRDRAAHPPQPCASCEARAVCRGGCRVVAGHLEGDPLAPDPECPRVIAWHG
jgi:radical SAM protein with 4Fe4S-binding SPASM domain